MDPLLQSQLAALEAGEFGFLRSKLLWSRIFPDFFRPGLSDVVLNVGVGQGPQVLAYAGRCRLMVGVDVNETSLQRSRRATELCGITNYAPICADATALPFRNGAFDSIVAVDVISVVDDPTRLCREIGRVIRPAGAMLMTFPGMQLRMRLVAAAIGRVLRRIGASLDRRPARRRRNRLPRMAPLRDWIALLGRHGFRLVAVEATSIIPPFHWLGLPRFWLSNDLIHAADRGVSRLPGMRSLGQALMAIFTRIDATDPPETAE